LKGRGERGKVCLEKEKLAREERKSEGKPRRTWIGQARDQQK
jgi:hypothetical protein